MGRGWPFPSGPQQSLHLTQVGHFGTEASSRACETPREVQWPRPRLLLRLWKLESELSAVNYDGREKVVQTQQFSSRGHASCWLRNNVFLLSETAFPFGDY